jgi:DNA-binding response OmpR family regulator
MSRIVIIEDDVLMRALMAEWLTEEGYCVGTHVDHEAYGPADLVIVAVYMPRHLGTERLRAARSAYPGVPIIATSGQFRAGVRCAGPAARALGADRVIAKPFGRDALLDTVQSIIGRPVDRIA